MMIKPYAIFAFMIESINFCLIKQLESHIVWRQWISAQRRIHLNILHLSDRWEIDISKFVFNIIFMDYIFLQIFLFIYGFFPTIFFQCIRIHYPYFSHYVILVINIGMSV